MNEISNPPATISSIALDSFDPEAMTETVQCSTLDHTLLQSGRFRGRLLQAQRGNCRLDWGRYNLPVLAWGPLAEDRLTLGLLLHSAEPCTFNGQSVPQGAMLVYSENHELHTRLAAEPGWVSLQLERDFLASAGLELPGRYFDVLVPELQTLLRLGKMLVPLLGSLDAIGRHDAPSNLGAAQAMGSIEDAMILALCESLAARRSSLSPPTSGATSDAIRTVRRAESYIDSRLDEPITIGELCAELGCPMHTLERLFSKTHGVSPRRFLTYRRLTALRGLLMRHTPDQISVTDAAMRCGLSHFGRTAGSYKSVFGEAPSDTLKRRPSAPPNGRKNLQNDRSQPLTRWS